MSDLETREILGSEVLSRMVGDRWLTDGVEYTGLDLIHEAVAGKFVKAVMQVPSAVIPQEYNYLIDPAHKQFCELTWSAPKPFHIDPRLIDPGLR